MKSSKKMESQTTAPPAMRQSSKTGSTSDNKSKDQDLDQSDVGISRKRLKPAPVTSHVAAAVVGQGGDSENTTSTSPPPSGSSVVRQKDIRSVTSITNDTTTSSSIRRRWTMYEGEQLYKCRDLECLTKANNPGGYMNAICAGTMYGSCAGDLNPSHRHQQRVFTTLEVAEPERCEGPCDGQDEDPPILMTSRPHAHSHGVRSITLVLALSFHSVIEGLAFGIAQTNSEVATLFLSVIIHKVIVAFSVGLQLARTHAHQLVLVFTSICILACMSPIGCAIGIGVEQSALNNEIKELVMVIFEGMAVGTFLYVTFFEVFIHERDNEHPNMLKLLVIIMGFGIVAGLRTMEHSHATSTDPTQTPSPFPVSPQSFNFSSTITTTISVT